LFRIQKYLLHDENDKRTINHVRSKTDRIDGKQIDRNGDDSKPNTDNQLNAESGSGVHVAHATAKWTNGLTINTFENINLTARPNRLVAIIGPVGAGKVYIRIYVTCTLREQLSVDRVVNLAKPFSQSSLIQAVLGELPLSAGKISVRGVVSYASQVPWLFSGSVRQNILFDSPMDAERYEQVKTIFTRKTYPVYQTRRVQVVNACALKNDFKQFPYGDRTTVGERGVTLSGGQRARINLAR